MDSDVDGDFQLSFEEFCAMLENDMVKKYLSKMKILAHDLRELFDIMDVDGSGHMDIREFFDCFKNVKGRAQSKHLLHLHQIYIGNFRKSFKLFNRTKRRGNQFRKDLSKLAGRQLNEVMDRMLQLNPQCAATEFLQHRPPPQEGEPDHEDATQGGNRFRFEVGTQRGSPKRRSLVENQEARSVHRAHLAERTKRDSEAEELSYQRAMKKLESLWANIEEIVSQRMIDDSAFPSEDHHTTTLLRCAAVKSNL